MIYVKKNVRVLPDDTDVFGRLNWLAYVRYCEEGEDFRRHNCLWVEASWQKRMMLG
jgi:acyl-CoA thioesterase FadM